MNKLRIVMIRLNDLIRSALSRGLPTWREKVSVGVIAAVILLLAGWYWRYGGQWKLDPQREARLGHGWVTNCSGPQFGKFSQDRVTGPGPARPMFKVSDQLVLAVPKSNWPSAGRLDYEPEQCRTIKDLPKVPYLYFVIQGNWSGNYDPKDVPLENGRNKFLPDAVTVRVESEPPSPPLPIEEQRKFEQIGEKIRNHFQSNHEVGGLTCGSAFPGKPPSEQGGLTCWGHRSPSEPDEMNFRTFGYKNQTPFIWINANYISSHYGGIRVYWQVWTLDVAHARDIDQAVWQSLSDWNLVSDPAAETERQ
jgi:hypothetical protein